MNNTKKSAFHMALKTLPQFFSLLYKNDKKYLFLMLLETAAFSIDKYPALLIMKYSVDALTDHIVYWEYVRTVIPLIAIMLTLKMLRVIVNTTRPFRDQVITENLFNAFFAKCMKMDYQTLENKEMQDKKELAKYITDGKIAAVGWYFVEMFSSLIAMIIAAVFMIRINGLVLIIVICGSSVKLFLGKKHTDQTVPITKQQVIENRYLSYLYNIGSEYEYVKEFRIFQYRENLYQKISGAKQNYITNNDKLLKVNLFHSLAHNIEDFIVKLLSFGIMGFTCFASKVTIGDFTYMIGLVNDFMSYADSFVSSCKSYAEAVAYVGYYVEFMSCNDILYLPEERAMQISAKPHVIEFQNVYFKYPNRDTYALKNINLKIETPVRISLVGRNGAGKSTLVKLLLRLYKPDQGQILLDGVSIYGYTNEDYMMLFSTVFQDFTLFAFTVSDNITSFDADADQHLFNRVSAETGVADFIGNYPDRYDTYLTNVYSDNGVEFSGGEQQKIALARSMYKDSAQFFALDEPTAAYDADAEYRLYRKYEKMLMGKVSIFISHRLSSCRLSDHIILLDNGEVIEEGSHAELMSHNTQYKHMYELQANQYNWGKIMMNDLYRCAAVFSAKNILVYHNGQYQKAIISAKINDQILVGDFLSCEMVYDQIQANRIVQRKNLISRLQAGKVQGLAANVDIVFIVTSANRDFNLARLERYYILAKESGARICFVLSKVDLTDQHGELADIITSRFPGSVVERTSIYQPDTESALFHHWYENETAVFLGSSGVGKSSLINLMLENEVIKTSCVRESDDRGRHTTTVRHMYLLSDQRVVIDTPGLRSVGISAKADTIDELFPEIKELEIQCKYKNCSHLSEPGCAIRNAIEREELDYNRYLRYLKLVGDESKRQTLLKGKAYEKERIIKELKSTRKSDRG